MKRLSVGSRCGVAKVVQKSRMQRNVYLVEKLNNHVGTREWGRDKEVERERERSGWKSGGEKGWGRTVRRHGLRIRLLTRNEKRQLAVAR